MKLEMLFIGAFLFSTIFIAILSVYVDGLNNYGISYDETKWGKLTKDLSVPLGLGEDGSTGETAAMLEKIQGGSVTDVSAVDEMIKGGYTSTRSGPFNALAVSMNTTQSLMLESGLVNKVFISFIGITFTVIILFSIIYLIFRFAT